MFESFFHSPISTYIILGILLLLIFCLVAGVFKFFLRLIFAKIKFSICLVLAIALISVLLGRFAYAPIQRGDDTLVADSALNSASEQFSGLFNKKLPFLAWKFEEVQAPNQLLDDLFSDASSSDSNESSSSKKASQQVFVRVSYLPFGEVLLSYDLLNQRFALEEGLGEGKGSGIFDTILQGVDRNLLESLPKAE